MDYIIFGTGSSATLVLIGWLIRDWGPRLRDRRPAEDEILSASDLVLRMAWARFCASGGMAILICGVLIVLATLGAALFAPTDRSATIVVIATFGVATILMLAWTALYLRQFGTMGVLRPRSKPETLETATATTGDTPEADDADGETAAPSFAETAAARGGLGRFASFFRRETAEEPIAHHDEWDNEPETDPDWTPEAISADQNGDESPGSPTDAVIEELSGTSEIESGHDDKKLAIDDPLVILAPGDAQSVPLEESLAAELPSHDSEARTDDEVPRESVRPLSEPTAEAPGDGTSSPESAIDQLRRRRLSRLANPGEPE